MERSGKGSLTTWVASVSVLTLLACYFGLLPIPLWLFCPLAIVCVVCVTNVLYRIFKDTGKEEDSEML